MTTRLFRLFEPPAPARPAKADARGNSTDRGYGHDWEKLSAAYRRQHPLCEECDQQGRDALCSVVDHMIPVADRPDLRLSRENLWSLCNSCHNGMKRRMEAYARKAGLLDELPIWCRTPDLRPKALRARKRDELIV